MKLHFAALVGIEYDMDLAAPWIKHYLDMRLDTYTVVLHRETGDIPQGIQSDYRNAGFRVLCADGPFSIGCARSAHLNNIADNLPKNDILVTADADEFQARFDGSPINYRYLMTQYDILHGLHEDRYSHCLENCYTNPFKQYPIAEKYTGEHIKVLKVSFIDEKNSPVLIRTKILAAPAGYPVEYKGSHCMKWVPQNAKICYDCKVIHFAWREGAARKLALKSYFTIDSLKEVYNNDIPKELYDKYDEVSKAMHPLESSLQPV
jgi:hypothetical protein